MNPQCARCGKVVYPTEKVNCLDKVPGRGRSAPGRGARRQVAMEAPPAARAQPRGAGAGGRPWHGADAGLGAGPAPRSPTSAGGIAELRGRPRVPGGFPEG